VRIRTLGGFAVEVQGRPLQAGRKSPRRILELLRALIALGGTAIAPHRLEDALWPESDGDNSRGRLMISIHRLRALLGDPKAVLVSEGAVSLNPQSVWLDLWAFERLAADARGRSRAVGLYAGPLMPGVEDQALVQSARRRLTGRFATLVLAHGLELEQQGDFAGAAAVYEHAMAADPDAGDFQAAIRRCQSAARLPPRVRAIRS
jgi:DNA-binding SARP family transcriptional activator